MLVFKKGVPRTTGSGRDVNKAQENPYFCDVIEGSECPYLAAQTTNENVFFREISVTKDKFTKYFVKLICMGVVSARAAGAQGPALFQLC